MNDIQREDMEQFHFKKVTQSEYRGGRSNISRKEKYLDCSLRKVSLSKKGDKEKLKLLIDDELDFIVSSLLPDNLHNEVKKGKVYSDIYKRLGI